MPNRLAKETSPYLKQHQGNPVDWYPWGPEALERAKRENKPIHLSVGYSACHWCHVMAHECFENPEIAREMNENFINIKVDREERPDLDQIYQNVAQALTQSGGWPLTVFLTPELKPFYGGTYFPPEDRHGRPGFPRVLKSLSGAYKFDPDSVAENADKLTEFISDVVGFEKRGEAMPTLAALDKAVEKMLAYIDPVHGGMGGAPKFPNPMIFSFLWRMAVSLESSQPERSAQIKDRVLLTLDQMAQGGIYDQLGGGFHRYSVDEQWSVPHFEKMLYDNGLLLKLYAEVLITDGSLGGARITPSQKDLYLGVLKQSVAYLLREMRSPEGGFYAAQDADSEGEEGKFFVWDSSDLQTHLSPEEARAFALRYGVSEVGNFEHGKTVLFQAREIPDVAAESGKPLQAVKTLLETANAKLLEARSKRIAPGLDNKILTSWNGLAISGLVWAGKALQAAGFQEEGARAWEAARGAFAFLRERVAQGDRLHSTFQQGQAKHNAYLDDYAFLAMAALDLARIETDPTCLELYLDEGERWLKTVTTQFKDAEGKGYFFTSSDHEALISRPKTLFDQAIPSGTAVALSAMLAYSELDRGGRGGAFAQEVFEHLPTLFPVAEKNWMSTGETLSLGLMQVVGPVAVSGGGAPQLCFHPFLFQKDPDETQAGVLICHNKTCSLPFSDATQARLEAARILAVGMTVAPPT